MSALLRYEGQYNPFSEMLDSVLEKDFFNALDRDITLSSFPRVDIVEEKDLYRISADLPGLNKNDISVEIRSTVLLIKGEKKAENVEPGKNRYYHMERRFGSFCREFALPDFVDNNSVEAKYENGVLVVLIKKAEEKKQKSVEVAVL
jgi:HSP20 family protein